VADSAQGIIRGFLENYGLGTLANWAWAQYQLGNSIEEIMLELRSRPEYKARFPAMEQLAKEGRAISEESYLSYETGLRNLVNQFGMSQQLYSSRDYVARLLISDVSLAEAQSRMQLAQAASVTAPTEYRAALNRLYGVTAGQLTSYWLDPDRTLPQLETQFAAATVAGEATMASLGELSAAMSQRLVEAGVGREQARAGFARASYQLGVRLPGETEAGLGADRLAAGVLGVGPEAEQFQRLVRQRLAAFAGGGGVITTQEGAALGSTRR
jgi:hypothetical protein